MKGVVPDCLKKMVLEKYGQEKWNEILAQAKMTQQTYFLSSFDVDDHIVLDLIHATCTALGASLEQVADIFGEYWMTVYTPKIYGAFFMGVKSSKEFFLKLDRIHVSMTNTMVKASPPRFTYEWTAPNTLVMTYISQRNLIDIFIGIARGVPKYFKDKVEIRKLSDHKVEMIFT